MTRDEALVALLETRLELVTDDASRDELLRRLDARRAGRDEVPSNEPSPLFFAATGAQPFTQTLVETPFEVDLQAWAHAPESKTDFTAIVRALVEAGEDVQERAGPGAITPLHAAVYAGRPDIAATLLALGADGERLDTWGRSPTRLGLFVSMRRLLRLFACQPSVRSAYLSQLYLPVSHQFTTPVVQLELTGSFPPDAFATWPAHEPLTVMLLGDDPTSRLARLGPAVYRAPELRTSSELAFVLAAHLGGSAFRVSNSEHEGEPFFVSTASGDIPLLVRRFGSHFSVSLAQGAAFQPDIGEPAAAAVNEIIAAVEAARATHGDAPSWFRLAWTLRSALERELLVPFQLTFPGTAAPTELWLRSGSAASIGVFPSGARVWVDGQSTLVQARTFDELAASSESVVSAVRRQFAHHVVQLALSERVETLAAHLLEQLKQAEPPLAEASCSSASVYGTTTHDSTLRARLELTDAEGSHVLAEIETEHGRVLLRAGLPGEDGVELQLDGAALSDATLSSLIAAMRLATTRLTVRRLRSGTRYRVLSDFRGLRAGEIVVYRGFNDIDNHYGEHEFTGEDGREVKLGGDCSNRISDPLAEVHRLLTPLDE